MKAPQPPPPMTLKLNSLLYLILLLLLTPQLQPPLCMLSYLPMPQSPPLRLLMLQPLSAVNNLLPFRTTHLDHPQSKPLSSHLPMPLSPPLRLLLQPLSALNNSLPFRIIHFNYPQSKPRLPPKLLKRLAPLQPPCRHETLCCRRARACPSLPPLAHHAHISQPESLSSLSISLWHLPPQQNPQPISLPMHFTSHTPPSPATPMQLQRISMVPMLLMPLQPMPKVLQASR